MKAFAVVGITFCIGMVAGILIDRYLLKNDGELTTDDCISFLKERGYWVNINCSPNK